MFLLNTATNSLRVVVILLLVYLFISSLFAFMSDVYSCNRSECVVLVMHAMYLQLINHQISIYTYTMAVTRSRTVL